MRLLVVFTSLILAISASTDEELWLKFKENHEKTYKSLKEDKLRFEVFKANLRTIEEHNKKYESGEETWFMGINKFTDLTNEEFKKIYLSTKPPQKDPSNEVYKHPSNLSVPEEIDWREKNAVLLVIDQGECGSCWAISAVGAVESQNVIKHNIQFELSKQELVDCSSKYGNAGCNGGWMDFAFNYIADHGVSREFDYPYFGKTSACKVQANSGKIKLTGYKDIEANEEALKEAVGTVGPISAAINADSMKQYEGGIFNHFCHPQLNHGVLVVGYGKEGLHDYWIVKNSWGYKWGEDGFIRMSRNKRNQCGIASRSSYPIIE